MFTSFCCFPLRLLVAASVLCFWVAVPLHFIYCFRLSACWYWADRRSGLQQEKWAWSTVRGCLWVSLAACGIHTEITRLSSSRANAFPQDVNGQQGENPGESGEGGDSWGLSPSERKPEQARYRAGIYRTGIGRSQNLILEVWKAEWSDSISCIHLESHNMENI